MDKIEIPKDLATQGYSVLQGPNSHYSSWIQTLEEKQTQLKEFSQSWNDLPPDNFLGDGGHYRFRRYSVFHWLQEESEAEGILDLLPHEPHFQSTYRNNMNGGILRDYAPFKDSTINNPLLKTIVEFVTPQISFNNEKKWRIQAHQFRIQANIDEAGCPTPEGIHRDGADFILIMLLERNNISGGVNHIYDDAKRLVFGGILGEAGDAVLLDDRLVWHGVSEVYPRDQSNFGYRDVLVLTFHTISQEVTTDE